MRTKQASKVIRVGADSAKWIRQQKAKRLARGAPASDAAIVADLVLLAQGKISKV
jgi:hypothetical protein